MTLAIPSHSLKPVLSHQFPNPFTTAAPPSYQPSAVRTIYRACIRRLAVWSKMSSCLGLRPFSRYYRLLRHVARPTSSGRSFPVSATAALARHPISAIAPGDALVLHPTAHRDAGAAITGSGGAPLVGATYERVSTTQQGQDGTSLDTQHAANLAKAAVVGCQVPAQFELSDVASGADPNRPGFVQLQELVARRMVGAVFVYSADRLARDTLTVLQFIRLCKEGGVALYFADGSSVETAEDEALQFLRAYFGAREREMISERTMRGKNAAAEAGRMPCGSPHGTYGYDYDKTNQKQTINEGEANVIRLIYQLRLDGLPVYRIAKHLNEMSIPTKTGRQWDARPVDAILRREEYVGMKYYGKARYQIIQGKRYVTPKPREEWKFVPGYSDPIVDRDVFYAVQEMWDRPASAERPKLWDYLFTGHFECSECGNALSGATKVSRGRLYAYYRCCGTVANAKRPAVCRALALRADQIESVVWPHIVAAVRDPSAIIEDLKKTWKTSKGNLASRIARLERDIQKCRNERMNIVRQQARGKIDEQMMDDLIGPIAVYSAKLERDLAKLEQQKNLQDAADDAERRIRACFLQYAKQLDNLDFAGKRTLLSRLKVRLIGNKEKVLVTLEIDPSLFTIERTLACTSNDKN